MSLPGRSCLKAANPKVDFLPAKVAPKVDLGTLLDPKRDPKSPFLAQNQHKIEKKSFQEGFQKKARKFNEKLIQKLMPK